MRSTFFNRVSRAMQNTWDYEIHRPSYWSEPNPPKVTMGNFMIANVIAYAITTVPIIAGMTGFAIYDAYFADKNKQGKISPAISQEVDAEEQTSTVSYKN